MIAATETRPIPNITAKQQRRREEVTEAVWQVILHDGLDAVSVRTVARRLGCTTGVVMYYFRTKDDLMLFAVDRVSSSHWDMLRKAGEGFQGVERLVRLMCAVMPRNAKIEAGWRIWLAFLGYAVGHPRLMAEHRKHYASLRNFVIEELRVLQSQKLLRPGLDLRAEANVLIAMVDGVSLGGIIDRRQVKPKDMESLSRRYVESLLAQPARARRRPTNGATAKKQAAQLDRESAALSAATYSAK